MEKMVDMPFSNVTRICIQLPPIINSHGIWDDQEKDPILGYPLPLLLLQLVVVVSFSEITHFILKHIGIPRLISPIISGFILSPYLLGRFEGFRQFIFQSRGQQNFETLGLFGYTMFVFLAGVKIDPTLIPNVDRTAAYIGISSATVPMVLGLTAMNLISKRLQLSAREINSLSMLTAVHSATNFAIVNTLLHELKLINSELGRLSTSSAMVGDIFTVVLRFCSITQQRAMELGLRSAVINVSCILALIVVVVCVFRPFMFWIIRQTREGKLVKNIYMSCIFIFVFGSCYLTNMLGHFVFLGALLPGLAVPDGPPLGSALEEKLDSFISGVFLPVLASSVFWTRQAYTAPASVSLAAQNWNANMVNIILAVITFLAKVAACSLPPWLCKMPLVDAFSIGLIMSSKGIIEVGTYAMFRDDKMITEEMFFMSVIWVLNIASIVAILVRILYDPAKKYSSYKRRNIMNTKQEAELGILTCIYRPSNISTIISFLNIFNPAKTNKARIYVLHLIELVGRLSPVFISHQLQTKITSNRSHSENVIAAFKIFEKNNEIAEVKAFTAISPSLLMHEDIRTLALNMQASFILLPFHKKGAMDGTTELEDSNKIRTINCNVLERAPCSVGILIHHENSSFKKESYRACMIFIGGSDDREALALATRMAQNKSKKIEVTVLQLLSGPGSHNDLVWDRMLDIEELKPVKQKSNNGDGNGMEYVEKVVADGSMTAALMPCLVNDYDVIIVGRRYGMNSPQTSGLEEMSEFPELGALGDLLVSIGMDTNTLVLVIQQQQPLNA